jgi:hypothetical protein
MAKSAGLYQVRGPSGTYYAVYDPATGRMWTERSEHSARAQAEDAGLELAPVRAITHHALMQLSGRGDTGDRNKVSSPSPAPAAPAREPDENPPRPITSRLPFASADPGGVLVNRPEQVGGVFSGGNPVAPPSQGAAEDAETPTAGAVFNRDVLDEKHPLPRGKGKNPFADRKPKRRD